jgi:hypothetical protein
MWRAFALIQRLFKFTYWVYLEFRLYTLAWFTLAFIFTATLALSIYHIDRQFVISNNIQCTNTSLHPYCMVKTVWERAHEGDPEDRSIEGW